MTPKKSTLIERWATDVFPATLSQCNCCLHGKGHTGARCTAYPDQIPEDLLLDRQDHRQPYPDDNGIRWEPNPNYTLQGYTAEMMMEAIWKEKAAL